GAPAPTRGRARLLKGPVGAPIAGQVSVRASIVIPLFNQVELTRACLASLDRDGLDDIELVLVDNASTDGTAALLVELEGAARVLRNTENLGFATACNQGAEAASAPVVIFLNNDTEVHRRWAEPLIAAVEDSAVGVAGSRLLYPDGRTQHAGMALMPGCTPIHLHRGAPGDLDVVRRTRDLQLVTGACMAIRRARFREAGGFDAAYRNGFEDADLCLRLAGDGAVARYCADSVVTHHESMSDGRTDAEPLNQALFRRRWGRLRCDWAERLAEDGVDCALWADCLWEGPLFDGSEAAERGREEIEELVAEGWRPLVRELIEGPVAPGAECPAPVLAGLNRYTVATIDPQMVPRGGRPSGAPPASPAFGWWGALEGRSGYARAGRGLLAGADMAGLAARHQACDAGADGAHAPLRRENPAIDPLFWVVHHLPVGPDGTDYWGELLVASGKPIVGAACFECDLLPEGWVEAADAVAEVWVPTAFNLRTFADAGIDPDRLHAIPYPVDTDLFFPDGRQRSDGPITFASVFEWTWRKGWDVLLRAWVEEFAKGEDVRLRILTYRGAGALGEGDIVEQATACIREAGGDLDTIADIELILDPMSDAELIELYRSADAFVLPTRGEGAGMPVIEAMACGTPVIATAWGGHEELMEPELAYPVEVAGLVEAAPEQVGDNPLYRGLRLAEPDRASLRVAMRAAAEDPAGARRRAERGRGVVEERFSIPAAGRALAERVDALASPRAIRVGV
ncbi:MAG: glycosyltransferase, partial [Miltoncostaeaceae bacterium]